MSILLTSLMPQLAREVGDVDTTNLYYISNQLFSALNDGVDDFNEEALTQQYSKANTGDSETISPTPPLEDRRLIVFYAALALTRGEIAKSARAAIIHSNPAGRTDLTGVVEALEALAERIEEKIEKVKLNRRQVAVEKEVTDEPWGVELKGKPSTDSAEAVISNAD